MCWLKIPFHKVEFDLLVRYLPAAVAQLQHLASSLNRHKKKNQSRSKTSQVVSCHGYHQSIEVLNIVTVANLRTKKVQDVSVGLSA